MANTSDANVLPTGYDGFAEFPAGDRDPLLGFLIAEVALRRVFVDAIVGLPVIQRSNSIEEGDYSVRQDASATYKPQRIPAGDGESTLWVTLSNRVASDTTLRGASRQLTSTIAYNHIDPKASRRLGPVQSIARPVLQMIETWPKPKPEGNDPGMRIWSFADPDYPKWLLERPERVNHAEEMRLATAQRLRRLIKSKP